MLATPPLLRAVNRQRILEHVRRLDRVSRAELAKLTSIRPPTVSAVIRELIADGFVEEVGAGEPATGTGRPPVMIALARNRPKALGFEISGTAIRAGVCDLRGETIRLVRVDCGPAPAAETLAHLHALGESLLAETGAAWSDMQGVGVALPGLVDAIHGTVRWSRPLGWTDVPLRRMCEERWGVTTDVVNNAVAGSLAAHFLGAGRDVENLIYLHLRFNVVEPGFADDSHPIVRLGSGIVVHGEPYLGDFGAAGEVSQPVEHPLRYARDDAGRPLADLDGFVAAVERGEAAAQAALGKLSADVGLIARLAVGILDPGMLILDSDVPALRDLLLPRLDRQLNEDSLRKEAGTIRVIASTLGDCGMLRGAVVPTLRRVFRLPR